MLKMDNVALIIQGYSTSKNILKDIYSKYTTEGFKNIIISSYSKFDFKEKNVNFINNDDILGNFERNNVRNAPTLNYQLLTMQRGIQQLNNLKGIKYVLRLRADQYLNDLKSFLKKWIHELNELPPQQSPFEKKIITVGSARKNSNPQWYISDNIHFGTLLDIVNMWSIPLTYRDTSRAEDYISTFYLSQILSNQSPDTIEKEISNGYLNKYTKDVLKFFIFDKDLQQKLYSYKHQKFFNQYSIITAQPFHPYHNFKYNG